MLFCLLFGGDWTPPCFGRFGREMLTWIGTVSCWSLSAEAAMSCSLKVSLRSMLARPVRSFSLRELLMAVWTLSLGALCTVGERMRAEALFRGVRVM